MGPMGPRMNMKAMHSSGDVNSRSKGRKPPALQIPSALESVGSKQPNISSPIYVQTQSPQDMKVASSSPNAKNCLCSPTTHAGSFRCRLHRSSQTKWNMSSSRLSSAPPPAVSPAVSMPSTVEAL